MLELVLDTGGRNVDLQKIMLGNAENDAYQRLQFSKFDAMPVRTCNGGPAVFNITAIMLDGTPLSCENAAALFKSAVGAEKLYIDTVVHETGEHLNNVRLLSVSVTCPPDMHPKTIIDRRQNPLYIHPATARMTVCRSDKDNVRVRLENLIKQVLSDKSPEHRLSLDAVSERMAKTLMDNGAWLDLTYPSLEHNASHHGSDTVYLLEKYSGTTTLGFTLTQRPCTVATLVENILFDPNCEQGCVTVKTHGGLNVKIQYEGCRKLSETGPFRSVRNNFIDPDRVTVTNVNNSVYWKIDLS